MWVGATIIRRWYLTAVSECFFRWMYGWTEVRMSESGWDNFWLPRGSNEQFSTSPVLLWDWGWGRQFVADRLFFRISRTSYSCSPIHCYPNWKPIYAPYFFFFVHFALSSSGFLFNFFCKFSQKQHYELIAGAFLSDGLSFLSATLICPTC